jgi:hypothetical protein
VEQWYDSVRVMLVRFSAAGRVARLGEKRVDVLAMGGARLRTAWPYTWCLRCSRPAFCAILQEAVFFTA